MVIGNYTSKHIYARILASIFSLLLLGYLAFSNRNTAKNHWILLVEEQAANLYNGEIKFKPIFDQACGIAYGFL
jgi:uncharacterized membrane protein YfcA